MIRNFSLMQVEHIAKFRSPNHFQPLKPQIKKYIGIGNSTGLGMAPFLIHHPLLINRWIEIRELALARVRVSTITPEKPAQLGEILAKCHCHVKETITEDSWQIQNNQKLLEDLRKLATFISHSIQSWDMLINWSEKNCSLQGQELLISILLELYPELVNELENCLVPHEGFQLEPSMSLKQLQSLIEKAYQWALEIDFSNPSCKTTFWYRSKEKMEPRLGRKDQDPGREKQMALGIAYAVRKCYDQMNNYLASHPDHPTARFLLAHPKYRGIIQRIQTLAQCTYGDIQGNLLDENVLPIHLLRAKLAFFGVSKFDPKSRLWLRNTMFQGAPLLEEIGQPFDDHWFMPLAPKPT